MLRLLRLSDEISAKNNYLSSNDIYKFLKLGKRIKFKRLNKEISKINASNKHDYDELNIKSLQNVRQKVRKYAN